MFVNNGSSVTAVGIISQEGGSVASCPPGGYENGTCYNTVYFADIATEAGKHGMSLTSTS